MNDRRIGAMVLQCVAVAIVLLVSGLSGSAQTAEMQQSRIAFASAMEEIWVMNADGSGRTRIMSTGGPAGSPWRHNSRPCWSPDGSRIAFDSDRDGDWEIYVMNADGSQPMRLTKSDGVDGHATWSPDSKRLAFLSWRRGNAEIYVTNADGSGQTNLTNHPAWDFGPSWSPEGTRIAFVSKRDGNEEIYVMDPDGSGQTRVTNNGASDTSPSWSPDGSQIAFISDRDGSLDIYVMDADGLAPRRLTDSPHLDDSLTWSPDGSKIAFHSYRDENWDIYVINVDGSEERRLTAGEAMEWQPSWSPRLPGEAAEGDSQATGGATPQETVSQFMPAWAANDAEAIRRWLSSKSREMDPLPSGLSPSLQMDGHVLADHADEFEYEIGPTKIDRATAIVFVTIKNLPGGATMQLVWGLVKEDEAWRVDMDETQKVEGLDVASVTGEASPPPATEAVRDTERVETLVEEALTAKQEGRLGEAETKLRQAIELDPENCQAHWVLAWTLVGLERNSKAVDEFRIVVQLAPEGEMKQEAQAAIERME